MFLIGEAGNCFCHLKLRAFRKEKRAGWLSPNSQHVLPHGFLFDCISCPHYSCEILSWLGFFLASWTLPAALFLLATIITLFVYAHKKHKAYQQEFDGLAGRELYPRNRKVLIPFVFWEQVSTLFVNLPRCPTHLPYLRTFMSIPGVKISKLQIVSFYFFSVHIRNFRAPV